MAEQQVTIGGVTHQVPHPFFVVATQNPIESEGVYQLPDAQRDRFMMKIVLDYPSADEEMMILDRMSVSAPHPQQVITLDQLAALQKQADRVFVDRSVSQYAVDLVRIRLGTDDLGDEFTGHRDGLVPRSRGGPRLVAGIR